MKQLIIIAFFIVGCTENQKVRNFGGQETINLPKGERLLTATWKGKEGSADLWYLTEPMPEDYKPQKKRFIESSGYGVWEGEVIFVESK